MSESNLLSKSVACSACVLSGGKSSRMGTDKAMLTYEGNALIEHSLSCLAAFDELLISAVDPELYAFTGVRIITDRTADRGPTEGISATLGAARYDHVCFRPVDTPLVPQELHIEIFNAIGDFDVCVPTFGGRAEPLLGCYSKSMIPVFDDLANNGIRKVSAALSRCRSLEIPLEDLFSRFGDPDVYLTNANDPETFLRITRSASLSDQEKR